MIEAIRAAVNGDLRLYPDPTCDELRETLAEYYGYPKDHIFVGNGSDEVLAFAFPAFFSGEKTILFPDVTYTFYPVYADLYRLRYETVPDGRSIPHQSERLLRAERRDYPAESERAHG